MIKFVSNNKMELGTCRRQPSGENSHCLQSEQTGPYFCDKQRILRDDS